MFGRLTSAVNSRLPVALGDMPVNQLPDLLSGGASVAASLALISVFNLSALGAGSQLSKISRRHSLVTDCIRGWSARRSRKAMRQKMRV